MSAESEQQAHHERVGRIVAQMRKMAGTVSAPVKEREGVSHFVPLPGRASSNRPKLNLKELNHILDINVGRMTCTAEPGVTFDELVRETLRFGLIPYTVPELKTITIGGAVSGCSLESMSFQYGGFHDSCLEYEIITGRGEVVQCSPDNRNDSFQMIHGSYGTLGILSLITFKLLPAHPCVQMRNVLFHDFDSFWNYMRERCEQKDVDFIDGIIHAPDRLVVCEGRMVPAEENLKLSKYDWLSVYYQSTLDKRVDNLALHDYFFRYDAECHWLSRTVPALEYWPVRMLLGNYLLGSTNLIEWSQKLSPLLKWKHRPDVVVDVFIPEHNFARFFELYQKDFDYYPLWIVPYRAPRLYPWLSDEHAERMGTSFLIDCAVYGKPNDDPRIDYSELLERKTYELNGIKTLISRNHYDETTFWSIYNRPRYESAKAGLDPDNLFGDLYQKFKPRN